MALDRQELDPLVEQARGGEASALGRLYEDLNPRLLRFILTKTGDEEAAADLAQETWMRVLGRLQTFRGNAAFGTWVHRIAWNLVVDARRRSERHASHAPHVSNPCGVVPPSRNDPLLRDRLYRALADLPEGKRRVLLLHDVLDHTHAEIAHELGCSAGTSRSQLHRARRLMRRALEEQDAVPA